MNPGLVVKLRPTGPWRIGPDSGARNRVDTIYHSDSLYSAITGAMARLGSLEEWLAATARETAPAVSFSSCFPFLDEIGFVIPPRTVWPPTSPALLSAHVRWKSARFVPLGIVQAILEGKSLHEDQWQVDGPSECLVPIGRPGPFRTAIRWSAAVDRMTGSSERHSTACIEFRPGSGLWTIVSFRDEAAQTRWKGPVKAAFRLLADSGFGGERSRGWGRSETPEFIEGSLPEMILPPPQAIGPDVPLPPIETPPEPSPVPEPPAPEPAPPPPDPEPQPAASVEAPRDITPLHFEPEHAARASGPDDPLPPIETPPEPAPPPPDPDPTGSANLQAPSDTPAPSEKEHDPTIETTEPVAQVTNLRTEPAAELETPEAPAAEATPPIADAGTALPEPPANAPAATELPAVEPPAPEPTPAVQPQARPLQPTGAHAHWLLSLFTPAATDAIDWQRGNYTILARAGRVETTGDLKKQLHMVAEGSVLYSDGAPSGSAPDVAPDGFAHPVFRAGFALAIPLPEVS